MDSNYLIWSLNRKKFAKMMAATVEYKERLGQKLNSEWFIKIAFYKKHEQPFAYSESRPYTVELDLYLCRDGGALENTCITFKLLTNTTVQMEGKLYFSGSPVSCPIGQYDASSVKGYMMDLIFIFPKSKNSENIPEKEISFSKDCGLRKDLMTMLEKDSFSDVVLKCNSEVLKAHKNILSARSSVFEAMFNCPMEENEKGVVIIKDMDPIIFKATLHYIYSGEVKITSLSAACDLLYVAEKYQLKGLKQVCLDYLKTIMTTENSIQVLEIADLYDGNLKRQVISLIKDHLEDLENSKDWRELKLRKPVLALEVYSSGE